MNHHARANRFLSPQQAATREGVGYPYVNAEAQALVARFTAAPDDTRKGLIDTLVSALKAAGVWSKLDALYVMAAHDAQAARQNWVADQYNLTAVASPTFTADRGYASDGASSYLRTGFTPRTASSPKMTQNSGHLSMWDRTSRAALDGYLMGANDGAVRTALWPRGAGNLAYLRVNDIAASISNSNSSGFFFGSRTGASVREGYRNGVSIGTGSETSGLLCNNELYLCGFNNIGVLIASTTDQLAQASIGSGLSTAEQLAFYDALSIYMTAVGA